MRTTRVVATIEVLVDVEDHEEDGPTDAQVRWATESLLTVVGLWSSRVSWETASADDVKRLEPVV